MLTLGSGSELTFIEVLTVNNYIITFLSNTVAYKQLHACTGEYLIILEK